MRLLLIALLWPVAGLAQDRAGVFDYYVLALSWSPTWCALEGDARDAAQCDPAEDRGWVLHGLWPQHETGWPSDCATSHRNPSRRETAAMADIMGSAGLAWHQWKKHGRCSGLDPAEYFALSREAYARIARPQVLRALERTVTLPARVVEQAFLEANPALTSDGITVTCKANRIAEARICLTRGLSPRPCGADILNDCRAERAILDPVR